MAATDLTAGGVCIDGCRLRSVRSGRLGLRFRLGFGCMHGPGGPWRRGLATAYRLGLRFRSRQLHGCDRGSRCGLGGPDGLGDRGGGGCAYGQGRAPIDGAVAPSSTLRQAQEVDLFGPRCTQLLQKSDQTQRVEGRVGFDPYPPGTAREDLGDPPGKDRVVERLAVIASGFRDARGSDALPRRCAGDPARRPDAGG